MPGRTVEARFVARMHVLARAAAPALAAGGQFAFDDALGAERHGHLAIEALGRLRHENSNTFLERGHHFGLVNDLRKMRRADFFFAFGDESEVDGHFPS